ncbi:MAG: phytanoyl-CoA dioxygenase family protein [Gammaproteobacteria bacterium]
MKVFGQDRLDGGVQSEFVPELHAARDPNFWRKLNPQLALTEAGSKQGLPAYPVHTERWPDYMQQLRDEGYVQWDRILPPDLVSLLSATVINLHNYGINPSFAFVYDIFWSVARRLRQVLAPVLGEDYRQLPDFWTWYIDPARQHAGWRPHRDRIHCNPLLDDGMPKSLTVWVALTNATPLNGCMYLLPANLDTDYHNFAERDSEVNVQGIRALPVSAGSILMWNQRVIHWGGTASPRAREPRISFAIEFQRADERPYNEPLLHFPDDLLPFDMRLMLVAKQFLQYTHMYSISPELKRLAEKILRD